MTYPGFHAQHTPDKPALVMARSGEVVTHRELDKRSNRLAQLLWARGLRPGDHVAIFADNHPRFFEAYWAAIRSGLYFTTVNRYLQGEEAGYIVDDCGARAVLASAALADVAAAIPAHAPNCANWLMWDGTVDGYESYEDAVAPMSAAPLDSEPRGELMLYSSGTTGRPKGIKRPLSGESVRDPNMLANGLLAGIFGFTGDDVYLSPAPLYHSAPLGFTTGIQSLGGTAIVMERFDPAEALALIERHRVTTSQWVPTMFSRLLKLPDDERSRHDLSSHRVAVHAAAPCPIEVKRQMIDWWGPIIVEYYAGTELNGFTFVRSEEWLEHPGTVGKPLIGTLHICDDDGAELGVGEPGVIYFERDAPPFEYHNDPEKTRSSQHPDHPLWTALGDVGYVDAEGFLYLTDRKSFMIIAGGVNIYPQEIEDCLIMHPKVADVAVFGVPNVDLGEEVKAVVQPAEGVRGDAELAAELTAYAAEHLARFKVPRSIDFEVELPRLPTGKLYKRLLRDRYWGNTTSRIV
ncbi:MAG: AMP-binding protein [Acidimicrobiia bacterium]|nr:AMP-binding protein [Acidimicrobiia bacterium]